MEPGPDKQVSEVELVSSQPPPRRGNNLLMLFILGCLIAVVTGGTMLWMESHKTKVREHETQWPHGPQLDYGQRGKVDYEEALAHMEILAIALRKYHDGPMGDGIRWPASIQELQAADLLDPEFDTTGVLSGREIVLQAQPPLRHDPERWVMCHDVEIGWMQSPTGFRVKGPKAAVVILADGNVALLKGDELETYGGLNLLYDAAR